MKLISVQPAGGLPKWTLTLMALGVVTGPVAQAQERKYELQPVEALAQSGTVLSGYVDTSLLWALNTPSSSGGISPLDTMRYPGRLYDRAEKMDGFNLNAVSVSLTSLPSEENWAAGYHVQMLYGPDAVLQNAYSLVGGPSDFTLKEAYITLRTPLWNGFEFRIGYFANPLGYEVYDSYRNPNYSRSYGYYIEPRTHTGVTAKYDVTEWFSLMGGVGNNYSPNIDARTQDPDRLTYLGLMQLTGAVFDCPDLKLTMGYTSGHTATGAPTDTGPRIQNYYAGLRLPLFVRGLSGGVSYDYQSDYGADVVSTFPPIVGPTSTYASATALYLDYQLKKLRFSTRVEYASATAGNLGFQNYSAFGSTRPMYGPDDEFLGVTATVGYQFWQNVISRLEFRWDHDCAGGVPVFGTANAPDDDAYTLALNIIYSF